MDALSHGIRLIVGLGMVAAGSVLVAPAGLSLARVIGQQVALSEPTPAAVQRPWPQPAGSRPLVGNTPLPPPAAGERLEYIPPPQVPQPLPPQPSAMAAAEPQLAAGYRPTLQAPPPPLLDGQAPPPLAVGWTSRRPASAWESPGHPQAPQPANESASLYIVRDGDDLASIATRFYGHPAAAAAIWKTNRGLLRDPDILPIGAAIVLPPRGIVAALGNPSDEAVIEPLDAGQPSRPIKPGPVSRPASWLTGDAPTGAGPQSP